MRDIMPEEITNVDDTTIQNGAEETVETSEIDYDQEFNNVVEKFETTERNREGYLKRVSNKADEGTERGEDLDVQAQVEAALAKSLPKFIPQLQATLSEDTVEAVLNELSTSDSERKLIRFHFENSVGINGTIRERLENAKLIANKKTILKTQKELTVALQNRQGLSNAGIGSHTQGMEVKDNFFSQDQLNALKARGWDDKKIERLKSNLQKK
jgi:hypothetical protein